MAARLPRLILFTGPNCSLCDVAKLELAKVRQSYRFDLETVNIQDKGQEKWKKKYVYWIPALHLDGKEIAKGRWDASNVLESMRQRNAALDELSRKHVSNILGETRSPSPEPLDARCCFNCGSPDHTISSCPVPHNRPLIALSRQLFNFFHPDRQIGEPGRFHIVEAWKQQRLEWLELFQPGEVVGPILREALGLQHGDSGRHCPWLYNMSLWGYPVGWVGETDPIDIVRQRILEDFRTVTYDNSPEDVDLSFFIFSDEQDNEVVDLTLATISCPNRGGDETPLTDSTTSINSDLEPPSPKPRRWAIYPTTHFSSERLTVYNGMPLTPSIIGTTRPGNTFTAERKALWEQITSGSHLANALVPPWRLPGVWGLSEVPQSYDENQPPPPLSAPPPLPPPPLPLLPSPPLPRPSPPARPSQFVTAATPDDPNNSDMDINLSDDE